LPLKEHWYGVDPIHIRPSEWRRAWNETLHGRALKADGRVRLF
jgi:hypothetical protein